MFEGQRIGGYFNEINKTLDSLEKVKDNILQVPQKVT
jgi:primosomal protein N''